MKKETYDYVGSTSIKLNQCLNELKSAQQEKEELLAWIDQLINQGLLEQAADQIREKMAKNLQKFKRAVSEIEALKRREED